MEELEEYEPVFNAIWSTSQGSASSTSRVQVNFIYP